MKYSFACPAPCNREIKIDANDHSDAVEKIIMAGAMSCRNIDNQCSCQYARLNLPPIPGEKLRHIVSLCVREELRNPYRELVINSRAKGEDQRYATSHSI